MRLLKLDPQLAYVPLKSFFLLSEIFLVNLKTNKIITAIIRGNSA